jgi:predicted phosphodiesterase
VLAQRYRNGSEAPDMKVDPPSPIRHLGVIGDVHARAESLETAANALSARGVDAIACVGDIYGPATGTAQCCRLLKERRILTVRGNHDRWFLEAARQDSSLNASVDLEAVRFLSDLPVTLEIDTVAGPALLCHGIGTNDLAHLPQTFPSAFVRRSVRLGLISPRHKLVIHGHSHDFRQRTCEGILFVAIGTLQSHSQGGCVVIDAGTGIVSQVEYR